MIIQPQNINVLPSGIGMGICDDAKSTKNKTVALDNFELTPGAMITVKFTNTATDGLAPSDITLNVNNTGEYGVYTYYNDNNRSSSTATANFCNNYVGLFFFTGFFWALLNYNGANNIIVIDSLTKTYTNAALSANQGKVLKGYIDDINTKLDGIETLLSSI